MADKKMNAETLEFLKEADLVFMVNFKTNTQNVAVSDGITVADLISTPFRLSLHLNQLMEAQLEGQAGETVEETPSEENS